MTDRWEPEYVKRRWFVYDRRERIVRGQLTKEEAEALVRDDPTLRIGERNLG